jgi:replicative DNA helicase
MPGEAEVPPGPHRDLLFALHREYTAAGPPGLRTIKLGIERDDSCPAVLSHQTVGSVLNGKALPSPLQVRALGTWLAKQGRIGEGGDDAIKAYVDELLSMRQAAEEGRLSTAVATVRDAPALSDAALLAETQPIAETIFAERATLACMLQSMDAIADVVEVVKTQDFFLPEHQAMYTAMLDLYGQRVRVTVASLTRELGEPHGWLDQRGGENYLSELASSVSDPRNAESYADTVRELAILRRVLATGEQIANWARAAGQTGDRNIDGLTDQVEEAVFALIESFNDGNGDQRPLESALDEIEAAGGDRLLGLPSGFHTLDAATRGFRQGEFILLAAGASTGKSTLALDFARCCSVKHDMTSAFFSLQMTRDEMTMRMLSAESGTPMNRMQSGEMTDDDWQKVAQKVADVDAASIHIIDKIDVTVEGIRSTCRRIRQRHGLHLVIIDTVELVRPIAGQEKDLSGVAHELRAMARELRIPVIAVSQLGRRREHIEHLPPRIREVNYDLEEAADMVMLLHRFDNESSRMGEASLAIAKWRHAPPVEISLAYQGNYSRFIDMADSRPF